MKKWVDCIIKIVQRRLSNDEASKDIIFDFDRSPPSIEIHIENPESGWPELLTVSATDSFVLMTSLKLPRYSWYHCNKAQDTKHCRANHCMAGLQFHWFGFSSFCTYKYHVFLFGQIQSSLTGDQLFSHNRLARFE